MGHLVVHVDVGFGVGLPDAFEILPLEGFTTCGVGVVAVRVHKERTILSIISCHSARVRYVSSLANVFVVGTTFGNELVGRGQASGRGCGQGLRVFFRGKLGGEGIA